MGYNPRIVERKMFANTVDYDVPSTESVGRTQFLDGSSVVVYIAPDRMLRTDREEIVEGVNLKRFVSNNTETMSQQMNKLLLAVRTWGEQYAGRISGIYGVGRLGKAVAGSDLPRITANFIVIQSSATDKIDEELWLDLAEFDVQIAKNPEFSNVRMNISAMPFIRKSVLEQYLEHL